MDEGGRSERLEERVEIDPDNLYEKIEVPRFGNNRPAVFVHDFRMVSIHNIYIRHDPQTDGTLCFDHIKAHIVFATVLWLPCLPILKPP